MAFIREVKPSPRWPRPRWRVYHRTPAGEMKVGIYDTFKQAEKVRDRVNRYGLESVLGAGAPTPAVESAEKNRTPLGQYVQERWWPAWKATHPDSERPTRYRLNKRILPDFGDLPLGDLDADAIGLWKASMVSEGLKPQTINTYLALLGTVLNAAVDSGYLERSPLLRRSGAGRVAIARNMPVEKREVWLTRPQFDRLVAAIDTRYRALVLVAALTGMRWGEIIPLRWQDLRLDTPLNDGAVAGIGRVRITKAFSDPSRSGRGREKAPKTTAGRREIALDQETVDALETHRGLVGGSDGELVFTTAGGSRGPGGRLSSNNFARVWKKALEQAELTDVWPEYGGLRFHDLRHTHATWLIARQVPAIAVAKRLGHASPVITMMVYAHVTELVQAGTLTTGDLGLTGRAPVVPLRPGRPSVS